AIGSVMWNWRMLNLTGEAKYADLMERTLYNAVLPGISLDGTRYFYQNPLADRGKHRRQEWFGCACCPPNIARLLASLPGYFYSASDEGVYVHLYATSVANIPLPNGETARLVQKTNYPWDGEIEILIEDAPTIPFTLFLRVPEWTWPFKVEVISQDAQFLQGGAEMGSYRGIERQWQAGDIVRFELKMPVERIGCHPRVLANYNRVALQRGPLIYCFEQADHPETEVWDIFLHEYAELNPEFVPALLGGVTVLRGRAAAPEYGANSLYAPCLQPYRAATRPIDVTAIPYYAWANRDPGPMQVWMPTAPPWWSELQHDRNLNTTE
ncbi:MAG TPA: beta-L-arabinofuranosidase domain-containing protein, partial [Chthonomonadaceae bacterium]|nr:beta-L-arabinofuranosidase domain-containing protein [Chthonomonadaceae bacterium]